MSEQAKPAQPLRNSSSVKQRLLVVAGGAVLLIVILVIVFGVLLRPGSKGLDQLYQVMACQQDIAAMTEAGQDEIKDRDLKNLTASVNAVVNTHLVQTKASINKLISTKKSAPKIKLLRDSAYEKTLNEAKTAGTYDTTFTTVLANRLDQYRTYLSSAYSAVSSQNLKNQINEQYVQANELGLKE